MIAQFRNLEDKEANLLLEVPVLITILIAGADGKIDDKEIDWGTKLAHLRAVKEDSSLHYYYTEVDRIFNDSLREYISRLAQDTEERSRQISEMLSSLNDIFPKIDYTFAENLYKSYISYAMQVAKSSGGVLGYASISPDEQKWLNLDMIDPPSKEKEDE